MALAAGMTYYSILAIFPAIAALVAMYGLFSDPSTIARHLDQLGGFLPNGAIDIAREQLTRVAAKGSQTLGVTFALGLGVSLWSANAAMKSLFDTLKCPPKAPTWSHLASAPSSSTISAFRTRAIFFCGSADGP